MRSASFPTKLENVPYPKEAISIFLHGFLQASKLYRDFYIIVILHMSGFLTVSYLKGITPVFRVGIAYFYTSFILFFSYFLVLTLLRYTKIRLKGTERPFLSLMQSYYSALRNGHRAGQFLNAYCIFIIAYTSFSIFKSTIPKLVPFYADPAIADLEHRLFFGQFPHELFGWVYQYEYLIVFLDALYLGWTAIIVIFAFYLSLKKDAKEQIRILYCYVFGLLVAGNIIALLFSSVGPVFHGSFFAGIDAYDALNLTLNDIHARTSGVWAVVLQGLLLDAYSNADIPVSGISAMPSIHVYLAFLIAISFKKYGYTAFIIGFSYAILIFLGSFLLAWHYLLDGVVSIALVSIMWRLSSQLSIRAIHRAQNE